MRLEDLEVFRAVHEAGSFQRAAQRIGLSQSAVTKVVRKLEEEFRLQLVERGARTATLTPAGRTFYERALEFAELAAATRGDMAGEAAALRGSIRLGVVPALLNSVATPVLADLLASPGDVRLLLSVKHSAELERMVQEAKLDLALCFGVQHLPPDIVRARVARQRYRFVVRAGHPLEGQAPGLESLARLRWLLPSRDATVRSEIERLFAEAGLGLPDVRVETDASAALLLPLLRRSDLVAVLADQSVPLLAAEGLTVLETGLDALFGDISVVHRRLTPSTGLLMQMKDRLAVRARAVFPA
jgi:DNA-binding transcriptional LysR family regulator